MGVLVLMIPACTSTEVALGAGVYPLHYDLFHNEPNGQLYDTRKKTRFGLDNAFFESAILSAIHRAYTPGFCR